MTSTAILCWLQRIGLNTEADAEVFIDALIAIPAKNTLVNGQLRPILLQLAISKNYQIRQVARQLLTEAGVALPNPTRTPLPTAYSLRFNVAHSKLISRLTDLDTNHTSVYSAHDQVQPYGAILDQLAKQAGLDYSALCYRTLAIKNETASAELLAGRDDQKLVKQLRDINVKYDSFSLLIAVTRRAVMHLVTEMLDAGVLTERWAAKNLPVQDYAPRRFPEVSKPSFIHTLKRHQMSHVPSDWVEAVESSPLLQQEELSVYQPGWLVIGEYSLVRSLNWGTATETYRAQLTVGQQADEDSDEDLFSVVFNQLASEYYTLSSLGWHSTVVCHRPYLQHTLKSKWLAFNPSLAKHLGWQPAPGQLFGWQDQADNLMVKSVYWVNGNIEMPPPRLESEAGEGWLVLASPAALAQLSQLGHTLFVEKWLTRSHWRQQEKARAEQSASVRLTYSSSVK